MLLLLLKVHINACIFCVNNHLIYFVFIEAYFDRLIFSHMTSFPNPNGMHHVCALYMYMRKSIALTNNLS